MPSSINYTTKFTELGKLIKKELSLQTLGSTTLPSDLAEILAAYGTANTGTTNAQNMVAGLSQSYESLMNTVQQMRQIIINYSDATITDFDTVASLLPGASSQDINTILTLLYQDMLDNGQSVQQSVVTIGAVSADPSNIGTGTVLLDGYLDGFQPGIPGGFQHIRYAGIKSEMAPTSLSHAFTCTSDSYSGGTAEGSETFSWNDSVAFGAFSSFPEGAGTGPSLTCAGNSNVPGNGDFENWTSGIPSGWTLAQGTTSDIAQDTTNFFTGATSLKFVGGISSTKELTFPIPLGTLNTLRRYCVSFAARSTGSPASGVLSVSFQSATMSFPASAQVTIAANQLSSSWVRYHFYFAVPPNVPSDLALSILVSGGLPAGTSINTDALHVDPVTYFAGINADVVPGDVPFVIGDKFYATATSVEGIIQKFFRLRYLMQLPSAPTVTIGPFGGLLLDYMSILKTVASAPTLPDSLAQ